MAPGTKRASSIESNEAGNVEDRACWSFFLGLGGSSRRVASSNEKPHEGHDKASSGISFWQEGQWVIDTGLYHRFPDDSVHLARPSARIYPCPHGCFAFN